MENNKLSSYRVTDLPQLTDLNNKDLFLITHSKETGGYESQSIPFSRLMRAVKRRGFKDEISALTDLYVNAARKTDLAAEARTRAQQDAAAVQESKKYTDQEISKVHTHKNLAVLSTITNRNVSQWNNDAGYLSAHQSLSGCATKTELADELSARREGDIETLASAKSYADEEIAKVHTHDNLQILSTITNRNVSQWNNDAGYLSAHQSLTAYATKTALADEVSSLRDADVCVLVSAESYADVEIAKIHTHGNLEILSSITSKDVSQWNNDAEYVTAPQLGTAAYTPSASYSLSSHDHDGVYSKTGHVHAVSDITDISDYVAKNDPLSAVNGNEIAGYVKREILKSAAYTLSTEYSLSGHDHDLVYSKTSHVHAVSDISDFPVNVSHFANDAGYLSAHRPYAEISDGIHLSDYELRNNLKSAAYEDKEYFAVSSHTHDDRYYTETETDAKISGFVDRSEFGSAAFTETSDYLAEKDFTMKYTTGEDVLCLSVGKTVLSVKIETSGGQGGTTYEYVKSALSNDGYALKTRIRVWED